MRADLALLSRAQAESFSGARLHSWSEPTLTVGKTQTLDPNARNQLLRSGIQTVVRPTGGGWLVHLPGDLALTCALGGPLRTGGFRSAARQAAEWIRAALGTTGLFARITDPHDTPASREEVCFERADRDEVLVDGVKVAGVALARISGGALVQCAVPLVHPDARLAERIDTWDPQRERAVEILAGRGELDYERLHQALVETAPDALLLI